MALTHRRGPVRGCGRRPAPDRRPPPGRRADGLPAAGRPGGRQLRARAAVAGRLSLVVHGPAVPAQVAALRRRRRRDELPALCPRLRGTARRGDRREPPRDRRLRGAARWPADAAEARAVPPRRRRAARLAFEPVAFEETCHDRRAHRGRGHPPVRPPRRQDRPGPGRAGSARALADAGLAWTDMQFGFGASEAAGNADAVPAATGPDRHAGPSASRTAARPAASALPVRLLVDQVWEFDLARVVVGFRQAPARAFNPAPPTGACRTGTATSA